MMVSQRTKLSRIEILKFLFLDACHYHPGAPVFHDAMKVMCDHVQLLL